MKKRITEAQLQARVKCFVEKIGGLFRFIDYRRARNRYGMYLFGKKGCPDCLIKFKDCKPFFVELKSRYGRVSQAQEEEFAVNYGMEVYIVRTVKQMQLLVEKLRGNA